MRIENNEFLQPYQLVNLNMKDTLMLVWMSTAEPAERSIESPQGMLGSQASWPL